MIRLLSPWFKPGRRPRPEIDPTTIKKVLLIKPEKLGDMVVTLPLVQALLDQCEGLRIDLLASPKGAAIVEKDPRFSHVWLYTKRWASDLHTIRMIRRNCYDAVIEMIDDDSSTGLLLSQFCAKKTVRIGANKRASGEWYDHSTDYHANPLVHAIDRALDILPLLGLDRTIATPHVPPFIPESATARAKELFSAVTEPYVAFNISGGKATRQWATDDVIAVVRTVLEAMPDLKPLIICAPHETARGEAVVRQLTNVSLIPANCSILEIAALLSRLSLVVSPDTSIVHIARSFNVPVVGLYPALEETVRRWGPYGQTEGIVRSNDIGDIAGIDPKEIAAKALAMLQQQGVTRP